MTEKRTVTIRAAFGVRRVRLGKTAYPVDEPAELSDTAIKRLEAMPGITVETSDPDPPDPPSTMEA